jgi:ferredoxin
LEELGPLFVHPQSQEGSWSLVLLFSTATIALASIALVRGRLPVALSSSGLLLLPVFAYVLGNIKLLEESKQVEFCGSCHETMSPVVEAMRRDGSTLAGLHFRRGAVSYETACYQCHSGYGVRGDLKAKTAGIKHMLHTVMGSYEFPLVHRGTFDIDSCRDCHAQAIPFREVDSHRDRGVQDALLAGDMSCTGMCHPSAHPPEALTGVQGGTK